MSESADNREWTAREADRLCGALDVIAATERQINALQAKQARQVAQFVRDRRDFDMRAFGSWGDATERITAAELADARRVGVWTAHHHMADCARLVEAMPRVMDKLDTGAISLAAARSAVAEIHPLHPAALPLADEVIADEIDTVLPGRVRAMARTRVLEIDPDAAREAAIQARSDRSVSANIDTATAMGALTAQLPAEQVVACWNALDHHARCLRADGDNRTVSQLMADTLVERVTGQARADDVAVAVNVVMNTSTLFGADDAPAQLDQLGPLPAAYARELAAGDRAWLRRWFTDPADATVATIDTRMRRFTGAVRELVKARDRRCRGIGCDAVIRDADHLQDHSRGGRTGAGNGAGLCQRCHHLEDHPQMSVEPVVDDDPWLCRTRNAESGAAAALLRWTTPIGRTIATQARPALGYGTCTRAQLRHRRRLHDLATGPPQPPYVDAVTGSPLEIQLQDYLRHAA